MERVILRCLQPDPRQRPPTAAAVAAPPAAIRWPRPSRRARRHRQTRWRRPVAGASGPRSRSEWRRRWWGWRFPVLAPTQSITSRLPLDNSRTPLTRDARAILQELRLHRRPAERPGADLDDRYQAYLVRSGGRGPLQEPADSALGSSGTARVRKRSWRYAGSMSR